MSFLNRPSKALAAGAMLAFAAAGIVATAGPAAAANGIVGQTMTVCTTNPAGLALRGAASPDAVKIESLENGWHFAVYADAANGMLYGYSPILQMKGYVDDGHFC